MFRAVIKHLQPEGTWREASYERVTMETWLIEGCPVVFLFEAVSSPHREEKRLRRLLKVRGTAWLRFLMLLSVRADTCDGENHRWYESNGLGGQKLNYYVYARETNWFLAVTLNHIHLQCAHPYLLLNDTYFTSTSYPGPAWYCQVQYLSSIWFNFNKQNICAEYIPYIYILIYTFSAAYTNCIHFQPPTTFSDPLHIVWETTLVISGLAHIDLLGREQLWLTVCYTNTRFDAHVCTVYASHRSTYCTSVGVCSLLSPLVTAHETHARQT